MFGYIVIDEPELKIKDFRKYRSYYCGLCRQLRKTYGVLGELTLSYDCTFLVMLLSALYEPQEREKECRCAAHPFEKHNTIINEYTEYVADMNIILAYYNSIDDWRDEKKIKKLFFAKAINRRKNKAEKRDKAKTDSIVKNLDELSKLEKENEESIDKVSGCFGRIMGDLFAYGDEIWHDTLYKLGFFLGKYIYILDAYEDIEDDIRNESYNPLKGIADNADFDDTVKTYLTMMMSECSRQFELLPIIKDATILRNILYSGVWSRYEATLAKRKGKD